MSMQQRGLGRGLDALFGDASTPATGNQTPTTLPVDKIVPGAQQPRKVFAEEPLEELASSIRSQGVVQPLLVRPVQNAPGTYEIVAGERRWRAARMAGLTSVPVLVRNMSDEEVMLAALVENLQREDLNPIEEALALKTIREQCQLTQEEMATRLGKSRPAIANALRLLTLSPQAQEDVQSGALHAGHARALLSIPDLNAQELLRHAIVEKKLNVRETENAAAFWKNSATFPWEGAHAPAQRKPARSASDAGASTPAFHTKIQAAVEADLGIKAKVVGNPMRGKITLSYANEEELQRILAGLGITNPELMQS